MVFVDFTFDLGAVTLTTYDAKEQIMSKYQV